MDDADAIRACQGQPDALEHLYRRHALRLHRWVTRELSSDGVALEIVAESFAQVLVSAHRFRGSTDREAAAWLDGIARNLVRRYRRRQKTDDAARRQLEIAAEVAAVLALGPADGDETALDALEHLSPKEREAVRFRVIDGLSYPEIGRRLDADPQAIRQRVSRGLRSLRSQLGR